MKKTFILSIIACAIIATSCKKNNDTAAPATPIKDTTAVVNNVDTLKSAATDTITPPSKAGDSKGQMNFVNSLTRDGVKTPEEMAEIVMSKAAEYAKNGDKSGFLVLNKESGDYTGKLKPEEQARYNAACQKYLETHAGVEESIRALLNEIGNIPK